LLCYGAEIVSLSGGRKIQAVKARHDLAEGKHWHKKAACQVEQAAFLYLHFVD